MHVVIFEGAFWSDFAPFTLTRPVFMLRSGAHTLLEKQIRATQPSRITFWVREEMADFIKRVVIPTLNVPASVNTPLDSEPACIFSGRTLHFARFERPAEPCIVAEDDGLIKVVYASLPGLSQDDVLNRSERWLELSKLPRTMPQARFGRHWGDLVAWNEESIMSDSIHWNEPPPTGGSHVNAENIHARDGVQIGPGAVLDASRGPILLDTRCSIGANSVIEGPVYIGVNSRITPLSYIRCGASIGPMCRVGGEVSNTIFLGHANKSHDGFVGDSYIGEWVNCGAGTTTSNLKSTYGEVRLVRGSQNLDSGRLLLGAGVGDHTKLATNTQLPAGAYIGTATLLALSGRAPKFVPSFRFITDDTNEPMAVDKAAAVAERMAQRRGKTFDPADRSIMDYAARAAREIET